MASFGDINLMKKQSKSDNKRRRIKRSELVKVVYISSPMKVKTSASRFRSLVQELTGRDSDISRFDHIGGEIGNYNDEYFATTSTNNTPYSEVVPTRVSSDSLPHSLIDDDHYTHRDSPTSSESLLDDVFCSDMVERLEGMLASSLFYDESSSQLMNVP